LKYSIQKLTEFSPGINVLGIPASNTDGFLSRATCVSSPPVNRLVWKKMSLSPLRKFRFPESIPLKN
jgi:hypothetical protein